MQMMKSVVVIVVLMLATGAAALGVYASTYNYKRDHANQEVVARAYIFYFRAQKKYPTALSDLVGKGYLPERAQFYQERSSFFGGETSYTDSVYAVFAPEGGRVEELKMIARKVIREGKYEWHFDPMINAMVRDEVLKP